MRSLSLAALSLGGAVLFLLAGGCDEIEEALDPAADEEANAAVASTELTRLEASLLVALADVTPLDVMPEMMAQAVADALPMVFTPADCVEAQVVAATVTATLDGCSGPRALAVSGVMNVAFAAAAADSVALTLTATGLAVNGASMTINATGALGRDPDDAGRVTVTTQGGGTAADGTVIGRLGGYTTGWDASCITVDGQWTSSLGTTVFQTVVNDFRRCGAACPAAGTILYGQTEAEGVLADGGFDADAITVRFDGSSVATFVSSGARVGRVALQCEGG